MCNKPRLRSQTGLTLVELVVFMMIVGVGLAGILNVLNFTLKNSANPMIVKQQIAIAESLLEEIENKPFTYCDPDDANVLTATAAVVGVGGCATYAQGVGASPNTETRYNSGNPYDNVGDYASLPDMLGAIIDPTNAPINGLAGYSASVRVTQAGATAPTNPAGALAGDVLQINITVNAPGNSTPPITLTGYRYRYAPNSP